MNEVQSFLQEAWADTERILAANRAEVRERQEEVLSRETASQIEGLRQKISVEQDSIAKGWKEVGQAVAILAGIFLLAHVCASFCNQHGGPPFHSILGGLLSIVLGVVGCLGAIVFGVGAWGGVVVVLGMALMRLGPTSVGMARIAKWNSEIASLQASRRNRDRAG